MSDRVCKTCRYGMEHDKYYDRSGYPAITCKWGPSLEVKQRDDWCYQWARKLTTKEVLKGEKEVIDEDH